MTSMQIKKINKYNNSTIEKIYEISEYSIKC